MKFYSKKTEHERLIKLAEKFINSSTTSQPVITVCKLSENAKKSFYAFHFEKTNTVHVGDIQKLEDGSIRRVEAVL